jgi:hypothetical protein
MAGELMLTVKEITDEALKLRPRSKDRLRLAPVLTREQAIDAAVRRSTVPAEREFTHRYAYLDGVSILNGPRYDGGLKLPACPVGAIRAEFASIMADAA